MIFHIVILSYLKVKICSFLSRPFQCLLQWKLDFRLIVVSTELLFKMLGILPFCSSLLVSGQYTLMLTVFIFNDPHPLEKATSNQSM